MFIFTAHRLGWLNGLLLLALVSQLLSGCLNQAVELGGLELPHPCYQTVVRRWRRPLCQPPFDYQLAWLIHWLVRTWARWLVRCGLLLALLLWKRAACPPHALGAAGLAAGRGAPPGARSFAPLVPLESVLRLAWQ